MSEQAPSSSEAASGVQSVTYDGRPLRQVSESEWAMTLDNGDVLLVTAGTGERGASSGETERLAAECARLVHDRAWHREHAETEKALREAVALLRQQAELYEACKRDFLDTVRDLRPRAEQAEAALARVRVLVEQWQGRSKAAFNALDEDAGYAYAECGIELYDALRGAEAGTDQP